MVVKCIASGRSTLFVIGSLARAQDLHRVGQLLQARLDPRQLGTRVPETLEMPVQGFPGGQDRAFKVGDSIRQRGAGRRNRGREAHIRAATATFGSYPAALIDAAFLRHASERCNLGTTCD